MNKAKVKSNSHNQVNNNINSTGNTVDTESDESLPSTNLDLSLLRKPIETSVAGFDEVLRAYESGTNELKKLLSKECDLIYECKVCRNIFRSLTNFISHKRVYCRSSFNASDHFHFRNNGFVVQDISTIIQAEQKINSNPNGIAGILPGSDDKSKDLSGIVEQLLWKQHQSMNSNVNDFYDQIQTSKRTNAAAAASAPDDVSSTSSSVNKKTHLLKLNRVKDSDIAVYQSLHTENDNNNSNMQDEINEVHKMLTKSNTVLGPDGKVLNLFNSNSRNGSPSLSTEEGDGPHTCQVCNVQFETRKTLKLHLEMKHLPSTYVYQCPSCTQKFSSSAAVIRHLSNDHKKSNRRIRQMRDNIIKKRVRADEVVTAKAPGPSRELQKLQISNGTDPTQPKSDTSEWNEHDLNANGDLNDSYVCPSCLKKFDRKAVYTSHVQMCSDIKDREQEKMKKRRARMKANLTSLESENSSVSEQTAPQESTQVLEQPQKQMSQTGDNVNKRKRQRTKKIKSETEVTSSAPNNPELPKEDSEDVVDWNLDDEEERKKLDYIKKEIIEDDYKKNHDVKPASNNSYSHSTPIKEEAVEVSANNQDDDDEENGLVIDLKGSEESSLKCPTCDKAFETDEKLKYHSIHYHSRNKRFKCKMCEYQGYRKKDTLNHINFVHNIGITLTELPNHIETVSKAIDEEAVAKQNELKKNQLRIKRKLAREKQRMKVAESKNIKRGKIISIKQEIKEETEDIDEIPAKVRRVSSEHETSNEPVAQATIRRPEFEPSKDSDDNDELPSLHQGKKSSPSPLDDQSSQRPIRNRIKPVRKDFLYDLSDLLKKEADAYREQVFQTNSGSFKRELRKRAMSTHSREMPNISTFDQPMRKADDSFLQPLAPSSFSEDIVSPAKLKDQRNRRMSVFVASPRQIYPSQPRSPPYKPPDAGTHKNAGSAHRMAQAACERNNASMFEPKYVWNVKFESDFKTFVPPTISTAKILSSSSSLSAPIAATSAASAATAASSSSNISAASSILQKLCGRGVEVKSKSAASTNTNSLLKPKSTEDKPRSRTAELCKKFELINVTNINESEFDIPNSEAINLNPGGNNLLSLSLNETENEMCVLQECSDSDFDDDDDDDDESDGDDSEPPHLEIGSDNKKPKRGRKSTKKATEKRRSSSNGQRLTVMQRLQENKIRKSREQLFHRLMNQQNDNEDEDESASSPEFDLFNEA